MTLSKSLTEYRVFESVLFVLFECSKRNRASLISKSSISGRRVVKMVGSGGGVLERGSSVVLQDIGAMIAGSAIVMISDI